MELVLRHLNTLVSVLQVVSEERGALTAVLMRSINFRERFEKAKEKLSSCNKSSAKETKLRQDAFKRSVHGRFNSLFNQQ